MRVITNLVGISDDKQDLNNNANFDILGVHAIKKTAELARGGNFT